MKANRYPAVSLFSSREDEPAFAVATVPGVMRALILWALFVLATFAFAFIMLLLAIIEG